MNKKLLVFLLVVELVLSACIRIDFVRPEEVTGEPIIELEVQTPTPELTETPSISSPPIPTSTPTVATIKVLPDFENLDQYEVYDFAGESRPCKSSLPEPEEGDTLEIVFKNGVISWSTKEGSVLATLRTVGQDGVDEMHFFPPHPFVHPWTVQVPLRDPETKEVVIYFYVANCRDKIYTWFDGEKLIDPEPSDPQGPRG